MTRFLVLLVALTAFAACSGSDDGDGATTAPTESNTPAPASDADPEALAREMIDLYVEMNGRLADLIEQDLVVEDLAPEIAALKDEYIAIFVATGYQREAMSAEDVSSFNTTALIALNAESFEHQDALNELVSELNSAGENDLASEITSLNILTQYAQFELLWEQEPEEAERLALPSPAHGR
ncbi:MAG TPA: hypothetical protein VIW01_07000 [Dehalococcoidia bacterium]